MNPETRDIDRVLVDLARRADHHPGPDRVPLVRRRARRAAVRRAAGLAGAVGAVIVAGAAVRGTGPLRPAENDPAASASITVAPPTTPFLTVQLARDDALAAAVRGRPGGITVVVRVTLKGLVRTPVGVADEPGGTGTDHLLGLETNWGDGSVDRAGVQAQHLDRAATQPGCVPDGKLVPVDDSFPITHFYPGPGTYTVTFRTGGCAPVGLRTVTLTITLKPGTPGTPH